MGPWRHGRATREPVPQWDLDCCACDVAGSPPPTPGSASLEGASARRRASGLVRMDAAAVLVFGSAGRTAVGAWDGHERLRKTVERDPGRALDPRSRGSGLRRLRRKPGLAVAAGPPCSAAAAGRPARPRRVCGCAAQSAAPLPPTRVLRRPTPAALWDRLADGTVGCVACYYFFFLDQCELSTQQSRVVQAAPRPCPPAPSCSRSCSGPSHCLQRR